ncbi:MAG TPA: hypothetical protein VNG13_14290 [Mycobacteriales bacterium]|nr:hypothetical protein [Mycobacteriales bacterium]
MAERYVRPPLVATDPPSAWAAKWRFRVILYALALIFVGLVVLIIFVIHPFNSETSPTGEVLLRFAAGHPH